MPGFDDFWKDGFFRLPTPTEHQIMFAAFRADPDRCPLKTPSGRIEIFSEKIASFGYGDCPGHPVWLEPAEWLGGTSAARHPLHLVSCQPEHRLHGQYDNGGTSKSGKIREREAVWLNPADAAPRGIADGDIVRLFNDRGACLAGAVVTDAVRASVVRLPTGAWYDPDDSGMCRHGNPNVLTLDKGTSSLAQGPSAHTCLVQVEPWQGPLPEVRAFDPPPILAPR
jgi:biotin/methionine sulfoxide reductase